MNIHIAFSAIDEAITDFRGMRIMAVMLCALAVALFSMSPCALAQNVSSVRGFGGGVATLFNLTGPGNLYIDNRGTQGYLYTPGQNFESYNFRNPITGQGWRGAVMTFGPQLSIGLIQGANQSTAQGLSPIVLPAPPRQTAPLPEIQSDMLDEMP